MHETENYNPTQAEISDKAREHNISMAEAKRVMFASNRLSTLIAKEKEKDNG